ncbi:peroxiredoxin-like family protein [Burkholderia sp. L27(2015)]|uniref:peroxiredoxin-like family protein n=1 Tax=Burkholderia sp. L27(2015) TaxID=1641858 RepID=UPI00131DF995|nr:peroxiredoxin-like family protein [Burkholderia sp. L27(2015)]
MGLEKELTDFRVEHIRTMPAGRAELYDAKVEELRANFLIENTPAMGSEAPEFALPNAQGKSVSLSQALRDGPVVVTFYRGAWCPYCNLQLRAYQRSLPEITALGGRLMAVSAQLPDKSLFTVEQNALEFDVLSDVGNRVARAFGLVYTLPDELRAALIANNKALPLFNGDDSWELPVPATYVIGRDRRIVLASVQIDYRQRLAPEAIVASLQNIRAAGTRTS